MHYVFRLSVRLCVRARAETFCDRLASTISVFVLNAPVYMVTPYNENSPDPRIADMQPISVSGSLSNVSCQCQSVARRFCFPAMVLSSCRALVFLVCMTLIYDLDL